MNGRTELKPNLHTCLRASAMQTDCFPDSTSEWTKGPVSSLAIVNPRYPTEKDRDYPFVEMASVGENFTGVLRIESRNQRALDSHDSR